MRLHLRGFSTTSAPHLFNISLFKLYLRYVQSSLIFGNVLGFVMRWISLNEVFVIFEKYSNRVFLLLGNVQLPIHKIQCHNAFGVLHKTSGLHRWRSVLGNNISNMFESVSIAGIINILGHKRPSEENLQYQSIFLSQHDHFKVAKKLYLTLATCLYNEI